MKRPPDHRLASFTLLELLVVIAIIAALAALLLPSLGKARERAKTMICANNLKALAQAALMYFEDNDGYAPGISFPPTGSPYFAARLYLWGYLAGPTNNLTSYTKAPFGVLRCPSEPYFPGLPPWNWTWYGSHYGWNRYFFLDGPNPVTPKRPGHAPKPSDACLVADANLGVVVVWTATPGAYRWRGRHMVGAGNLGEQNPGGIVNVAFLDGHVETLPFSTVEKELTSSATVTWLESHPFWSGGLKGGPSF